jgi:hypothetical protein
MFVDYGINQRLIRVMVILQCLRTDEEAEVEAHPKY